MLLSGCHSVIGNQLINYFSFAIQFAEFLLTEPARRHFMSLLDLTFISCHNVVQVRYMYGKLALGKHQQLARSNGSPALLPHCIRRHVLIFSSRYSLARDHHLHPGRCCILGHLLHQRVCPESPGPATAHRDCVPPAQELRQALRRTCRICASAPHQQVSLSWAQ